MLRVGSNLLFPLITFPYASRILGPDSIGVFNYIFAIASYFILFASFGFPIYGMREVAVAKNESENLNGVTSVIFTASAIFALIATLIYWILCFFILRDNYLLAAVIGFSIILNAISFEWFFQGIEDFKYLTLRGIIVKAISVVCLFIFVKNQKDLLAYGILTVAGTCGNNILNLLRLRKYIKLRLRLRDISRHVRGASVLFLGTVTISFYSYMNDILVGTLSDMQSVGYFSTSNKLVHIILSIIGAITVSIVPRMSHLVGNGEEEKVKKLQKVTLSLILHLILPLTLGLAIMSKPILELFAGDKFLPAVPALRILSLLILIIPISSFLGHQVLIPNRKEKFGNYAVVSGAIVNVVLALILIPKMTFVGVAISLVIAELTVTLVHIVFAFKYMRVSLSDFLPLRVLIASCVMSLAVIGLLRIDHRPGICLVWMLSGAVIYMCSLIAMKDTFILSYLHRIRKNERYFRL